MSSHILRLRTSPISSGVTSHGPTGLKVSADLPLDHCPPRSVWKARSLTSLATITCDGGPGIVYRIQIAGPLPITTPSSTSQSSLVEPRGMRTSSYVPTSVLGDFVKSIGSSGTGAPVSAAWSL
jgi:hypothetical protein